VGLLSKQEGAKVIAGGQSLIPLLKLRLASPALLVDINRIPGLNRIEESGEFLRIGALARMSEVEASGLIKKRYPIIHDAAEVIGDPLVRNLGTMGGNVSHGDPNNDMPAVMLALGAQFVATGTGGERTIRAQEFFTDTFTVALGHDEILTEIRVPKHYPGSGGCYLKLEQKVADFATAGAAVQGRLVRVRRDRPDGGGTDRDQSGEGGRIHPAEEPHRQGGPGGTGAPCG
jgi:carbon-monoxide dehydrogenase medium subunit